MTEIDNLPIKSFDESNTIQRAITVEQSFISAVTAFYISSTWNTAVDILANHITGTELRSAIINGLIKLAGALAIAYLIRIIQEKRIISRIKSADYKDYIDLSTVPKNLKAEITGVKK